MTNSAKDYYVINGQETLPIAEALGYTKGSVFRHLIRAGHKEGVSEIEDLKTARGLLDFAIANLEHDAERAAEGDDLFYAIPVSDLGYRAGVDPRTLAGREAVVVTEDGFENAEITQGARKGYFFASTEKYPDFELINSPSMDTVFLKRRGYEPELLEYADLATAEEIQENLYGSAEEDCE